MLMRLDKYLCSCGLGTRTEIKKVIRQKSVKVNGEIVSTSDFKVNENDQVTFKGQKVEYNQYTYIMLNKPAGVLSATRDNHKTTVIDLLDEKYQNIGLFPVGRLDRDTVGLVVLSNDGDFAHNTLSPKKHIYKTYIAHIEGALPSNAVEIFNKGVTLKDFTCESADLIIEEVCDTYTRVKVTIHEGKYHQIKRMFGCFGAKVLELHRITMGNLNLPADISEGCCREITEQEMKLLKEV